MNPSLQSPLEIVQDACRLVRSGIRLTPCAYAPAISRIAGMPVWLKRDDLQRTGSFKERGARHALLRLDERSRRLGVVAASAGNHALGLAYHGAQLRIPVTVVMPETAPVVKVTRCRSLGATVILSGTNFEAAQQMALGLAESFGFTLVHPFDDLAVIAGQGTLALEALSQVPDAEVLVLPVGGGGLLAGAAAAAKALNPKLRVVAVEPEAAASFHASFRRGERTRVAVQSTLADGLAVSLVGQNSFELARPYVNNSVTVTEEEITNAIRVLARNGAVVEGAGATALAAVLAGKTGKGNTIAAVTGRNIDHRVHTELVVSAERRQEAVAA